MLYRIILKQKTEFIGNKISANALLGAFLSACSLKYGDKIPLIVKNIVFSDLFLENNLPIGVKNNTPIYQNTKNIKRIGRVDSNTINRTLISRELYNNVPVNVNSYYSKDSNYEFYLYDNFFDKKELSNLIVYMLSFGLGKWRNVGKGAFELASIDEYIPSYENKKIVALSDFIPDKNYSEKEIIETGFFIRNTIATNGCRQPIKTFLCVGTMFNSFHEFVGIDHIYDSNSETYIHSKAICLGV